MANMLDGLKNPHKVTVVEGDVWDVLPDWNGQPLLAFRDWLDEIIAEIPEEHRDRAEIDINSEGGWEGEHHATIEISYWREETAEESAEREQEDRERREGEIARLEDRLRRMKGWA